MFAILFLLVIFLRAHCKDEYNFLFGLGLFKVFIVVFLTKEQYLMGAEVFKDGFVGTVGVFR